MNNIKLNPYTKLIQCHKNIEGFDYNIAINWAIDLIEKGIESENLLILSSFSKNPDFYEISSYVSTCLKELDLKVYNGKEASLIEIEYYVTNILDDKYVKESLSQLNHIECGYIGEFGTTDFFILENVWQDFYLHNQEFSHYHPLARKGNLSLLIREAAEKWIQWNENRKEKVNFQKSTPRKLLDEFYTKNSLGDDGGIALPYAKLELSKYIYMYIPNPPARKRALLKHDIHHLVTGYTSHIKGETEISAWEIAAGCKKYWFALLIDIPGMMMGLFFNLPEVYKAFVRGLRTKTLYYDELSDETVMDMTIADIQKQLILDKYDSAQPASLSEILNFLLWIILGGLICLASTILFPIAIIYTIYIALTKD